MLRDFDLSLRSCKLPMDSIRQYYRPNGIYHLTHTTVAKAPLLVENIDMWQKAWEGIHGHRSLAWTVLPDHLHLLIDPGQATMKELMRSVRLAFSIHYRGRITSRPGPVWDLPFWFRVIESEDELAMHTDYIHYDAVRHGHVARPSEWEYSSFHKYVESGGYPVDWGAVEPRKFEGDFGD